MTFVSQSQRTRNWCLVRDVKCNSCCQCLARKICSIDALPHMTQLALRAEMFNHQNVVQVNYKERMWYFLYILFLEYYHSLYFNARCLYFNSRCLFIKSTDSCCRNLSLLKIMKCLGFESLLAEDASPVDSRELLLFFTDTVSLWLHFNKGGKLWSPCISVKKVTFPFGVPISKQDISFVVCHLLKFHKLFAKALFPQSHKYLCKKAI